MTGTMTTMTAPVIGTIDADYIVACLEDAGRTLMCLPQRGHSTNLRLGGLDYVRNAVEAYGWEDAPMRPAVPSAAAIDRMDTVLGWIVLIPDQRYVWRKVVGLRALISPVTERHLFPWRRLGRILHADHRAVQRWHAQGVAAIGTQLCAASLGELRYDR